MYIVYPRLVEDFFWKSNMTPTQVQEIKYRKDVLDASGFEFSGYPLYKSLFLNSTERRIIFAEWYRKLFESKDIDSYCYDLVDFLFSQILN
jgi:hypothetical protein